jgi:uncharacterized membrane protein YdjX (TVP38/TMEM64 family)
MSQEARQEHAKGTRRTSPLTRRQATALIAVAVASLVVGLVWDALFGKIIPLRPEGIRDWLDGLGAWAPLVFVALMTAAVVVSPIPSVPLDIAAGLAFGLVWGTLYTLLGAEIGAVIAFTIARRLGRPRLARRLPGAAMRRIDDLATRRGARAILLMRLLPVFNFDWVSYAAGLTSMPLPVFALATFVGMIPPVIAIVAVGATISDNPTLAGAIFAALVLAVLIPLAVPWMPIRRRGNKRDKRGAERDCSE